MKIKAALFWEAQATARRELNEQVNSAARAAAKVEGEMPAPSEIPADYVPTPANATRGRCCS